MTASPVLRRDADGVRTLTVDRPDKLNALDRNTLQALDSAFSGNHVAPRWRAVSFGWSSATASGQATCRLAAVANNTS